MRAVILLPGLWLWLAIQHVRQLANGFNPKILMVHQGAGVPTSFCSRSDGPSSPAKKMSLLNAQSHVEDSDLGGWALLHGQETRVPDAKTYHKRGSIRLGTISEPCRVDRILSERGVMTRSVAARLGEMGKIRFENGTAIRNMATKILANSTIIADGQASRPLPPLLVYHKPVGVEVTMAYELSPEQKLARELERRRRSGRLAPKSKTDDFVKRAPAREAVQKNSGVERHVSIRTVLPEKIWEGGYHPVGRLDVNTTGVLLLSCDGDVTSLLLHPTNGMEREYVASVLNPLNEWRIKDLKAMRDENTGQPLASIKKWGDYWIRLVVREGRYRIVRKILERVNCPVKDLKRVRFGGIALGEQKAGSLRILDKREGQWLTQVLNVPLPNDTVTPLTRRRHSKSDESQATTASVTDVAPSASTKDNATKVTPTLPPIDEQEVTRLLAEMMATQGLGLPLLDKIRESEPRWTNVNWQEARRRYTIENEKWDKVFEDALDES